MAAEFIDKIDAFRQLSQRKLVKILDTVSGKKDIIIEGSLMKPLERFIGVKALRSHGVNKIFKLDKKAVATESPAVLYLIRCDLITAKRVCDQVSSTTSGSRHHLVLIPQIFHSIEALVEEEGLWDKVTLHALPWEILQIDNGLLSFESPEIFKYFFVARDPTYTTSVARSLWSLQHVFGKIPFKMFLGSSSKAVNSVMNVFDEEKGEPDTIDSDIGLMIVADRDVDYASALLTPSTYTSLIADVIGINTGAVEVSKDGEGKATMILTSEDETYNQIKHKHFSEVIVHLKNKISEYYSEQGKRNNMSVQEMRDFVKNDLSKTANRGRVLSQHLHLCEGVTKKIGHLFEGIQQCQHDILTGTGRRECITFIEDIISTATNIDLAMRLISLFSLCNNGLTSSESSSLKIQFFHAYGHEHLTTFFNLEKMGLFSAATTATTVDIPKNIANKVVQAVSMPKRSAFQSTAAKFKLFPDPERDQSSQDLGYVFGGLYIPLIAQLVSLIIKKERPLRELIKCLPGDGADCAVVGKSLDTAPDINPRTILVYVVGGITYAEIAALSLLERKTGCRIVCAGSSIINGNSLVQNAV